MRTFGNIIIYSIFLTFFSINGNEAYSQSQADIAKNGFEEAISIRQKISRSPKEFSKLASPTVSHLFRSAFDTGFFKRNLLPSSYVFVGCGASDRKVYGYYNLANDVWIIVWSRSGGEIDQAVVSSGFEIGSDDKSSWADFYIENEGYFNDSLNKALELQTYSFVNLFPYKGCRNYEEIKKYFSQNDGARNILGAEQDFLLFSTETRKALLNEALSQAKSRSENDLGWVYNIFSKDTGLGDAFITLSSTSPVGFHYIITADRVEKGYSIGLDVMYRISNLSN